MIVSCWQPCSCWLEYVGFPAMNILVLFSAFGWQPCRCQLMMWTRARFDADCDRDSHGQIDVDSGAEADRSTECDADYDMVVNVFCWQPCRSQLRHCCSSVNYFVTFVVVFGWLSRRCQSMVRARCAQTRSYMKLACYDCDQATRVLAESRVDCDEASHAHSVCEYVVAALGGACGGAKPNWIQRRQTGVIRCCRCT